MAKKKGMPQEFLIFVIDEDRDGAPIYGCTTDINEIDERSDGGLVGVYTLNRTYTFKIKRSLV